ncbi:MAG TPA: hypothetical protein VF960_01320, partial [Chloroflexota bacterium]
MPRPRVVPARDPRRRALAPDGSETRAGPARSRPANLFAWIALAALYLHRLSSTVVDLDLYHQMAL